MGDRRGRPRHRAGAPARGLIAAASVGATLINPYGWQMWEFSASVAHLSRDITEWQPLWRAPWLNQVAFAAGAGLVAVGYLRLQPRLPFERLIPIAGLGYAAVRAVKFVDLFVITGTIFLAPAIVARFPAAASPGARTATGIRVLNAVVIAGLVAFTMVRAWPGISCLAADDWRPDPVGASALLNASPAGRIVVTFDWGEDVIWHLGPRLQVSATIRATISRIRRRPSPSRRPCVARRPPAWRSWSARVPIRVVPAIGPAAQAWLIANGYRVDIDSAESFIAVRADVAPPADPGSQIFGCFPAP